MKGLRVTYKILRGVMVTVFILAILLPAMLFVAISLPPVQNKLRHIAESELTELLGAKVEIGRVGVAPMSSVTLFDVSVTDPYGVKALEVSRLGAGIDLTDLLQGDIRVTYAELLGMNVIVYRANADSPLNIQPIIDKLSKKDENKEPAKFDLAITTVVIRKSELHYDVLDAPESDGRFTHNHIAVYDLRADATLPRISNELTRIDVKRLAFAAENLVTLRSLSTTVDINAREVRAATPVIQLPGTELRFNSIAIPLHADLKTTPLQIRLLPGSHVTPADLRGLVPALGALTDPITLELDAEGSMADFAIHTFKAATPADKIRIALEAQVTDLNQGPENMNVKLPRLDITAEAAEALQMASALTPIPDKTVSTLTGLGTVNVALHGAGSHSDSEVAADIKTAVGNVELNARMKLDGIANITGHIFTEGIDIAALSAEFRQMPPIGIDADVSYSFGNADTRSGFLKGEIKNPVWKGYSYADILADVTLDGTNVEGSLEVDDPNLSVTIDGHGNFGNEQKSLAMVTELRRMNPGALDLTAKYPGYTLSGHLETVLTGRTIDDVTGNVSLLDLDFRNHDNSDAPALHINRFDITADTDSVSGRTIALQSEVINGAATGHFRFATLPNAVKGVLARINPELFPDGTATQELPDDDLTLHLSVEPENPVLNFLNLPVGLLAPLTIDSRLESPQGHMNLDISAPYIRQKDKIIEGTGLHFAAHGPERSATLSVASILPTKAGPMTLEVNNRAYNGVHDTEIDWDVAGRPNNGDLRFTTSFSRTPGLTTRVDVNPGRIVFNDTIWSVAPSVITIADKKVRVNNFRVSHSDQLVSITGEASADTTSTLVLRLRDINLDYVFETLNIPNVMFGGDATGTFYASRLFTKTPVAYTDNLFVKDISYNGCVMGDAHIKSAWHPEAAGDISINAVIDGQQGRKSYIDGSIHPTKELLDFRFKADKAPVGFLQPFMAAFCDGISGYASGDAHLYGTFKLLDMTGDIYGEDLAMDIGFTNTTYHTTDSVHIAPGLIEIKDVVITDDHGKTAVLSGTVTHRDFKEPRFNFRVTDARDFLAYDIKENTEHPWYGKVYGTGSVTITGEPGIVNIGVDMATAPGTDFTFVLSDAEVAAEYNFLTFRDKTPEDLRVKLEVDSAHAEPALVTALRNKIASQSDDSPTAYAMTFNIDVTPAAKVTLVMDPVGGDRIRATGRGNLRMSYDSKSEEVKMYGTYTLEQGSYNFTLQDIIIKDFTIENGSSIAFHGDPYAALLDIKAYYALNANLSDLDESFLQDRELNRTNVPVHAVMNVSGDMRSPEISFDLDFPTLTQDTYRKVRSIVSTDDMMNRQIIYLLALNRFYTPDYMEATRGNELVSVASSTISSQLSNMLGQLSDKFSIAPSFRSDRGDFSDVEVDVALSSQLLNNRLLLNGNFGYRDKSLNDNSFIGDFDIEYLLNRSGSIRLKAYNRYNDQNYYLKSALTTQGVGVVFKRDFDYLFDFVRRMRKKKNAEPAPADSVAPADTPTPQPTDNGKHTPD